jgi:hypothetical protein
MQAKNLINLQLPCEISFRIRSSIELGDGKFQLAKPLLIGLITFMISSVTTTIVWGLFNLFFYFFLIFKYANTVMGNIKDRYCRCFRPATYYGEYPK